MFWPAQPMVLKASVTPTEMPLDSVEALTSASMVEVFCASSTTSPPPVVVIELPVTYAFALDSTRLVAILALIAFDEPPCSTLPPVATTVLSSTARMVAVSSAVSVRLPAATRSTFAR